MPRRDGLDWLRVCLGCAKRNALEAQTQLLGCAKRKGFRCAKRNGKASKTQRQR